MNMAQNNMTGTDRPALPACAGRSIKIAYIGGGSRGWAWGSATVDTVS